MTRILVLSSQRVNNISFALHYWYRIIGASHGDTNKIINLLLRLFFLHQMFSHYSIVRLPINVTKSLTAVFNL